MHRSRVKSKRRVKGDAPLLSEYAWRTPRLARPTFAGIPHHVIQRGNRRETVFLGRIKGDAPPWRYLKAQGVWCGVRASRSRVRPCLLPGCMRNAQLYLCKRRPRARKAPEDSRLLGRGFGLETGVEPVEDPRRPLQQLVILRLSALQAGESENSVPCRRQRRAWDKMLR